MSTLRRESYALELVRERRSPVVGLRARTPSQGLGLRPSQQSLARADLSQQQYINKKGHRNGVLFYWLRGRQYRQTVYYM